MSVLLFTEGEFSNRNTRFSRFQRMFKIVFKYIPFDTKWNVQRFVQNPLANPSSFYGRQTPRSQTVRPKWRFSRDIYKSVPMKFVFSKLANFHSPTLAAGTVGISNGNSSTQPRCGLQRADLAVARFSAAELKLPKVTLRNWRWPVSFCIYWWKKTGLARENLWCLWKWKAKSEITKVPGSNVLLVPWKTPASFTIQEQLVLEKPQVAHRVVVCQHKSIKCSSPAQVKKLRHSKGSVSHTVWPKFMCEKPELFHEIKYWASRQKWNLQTRKQQTQTLELYHLLASNSEIGICVAPSIEISLDSNT